MVFTFKNFLPPVLRLFALGWFSAQPLPAQDVASNTRPNIVYILADDLGYGELGCYGQQKIQTPNLDALARRGMRFTQHYSGSPVCASSRCVLMTGLHTGHAAIRDNTENGGWGPDAPEGQTPLPADQVTIAELLKGHGYRTAAIGKWGLGGPGSVGHPNFQGFDLFYGYLCQRVAHNYYPTHLWKNHDVDILGNEYFSAHQKIAQPPSTRDGWSRYKGKTYAPDRMVEEAIRFIDSSNDRSFFLYYATTVPHAALQVPDDSLEQYRDQFNETPYLGEQAYLPHQYPRAAYAAMITRMDRDVGKILNRIRESGLADNTLVIFASDNGPTFNGGVDAQFFQSAEPLRGLKVSVHEGGIRVPMIAAWPGHIKENSTSDLVSGFQDVLPTLCDIAGCQTPGGLDGISLAPTLVGDGQLQDQHEYLYWELNQQQALRVGDWKLVRRTDGKTSIKAALFNLANDIAEKSDLAQSHPEKLRELIDIAASARTRNSLFPSAYD